MAVYLPSAAIFPPTSLNRTSSRSLIITFMPFKSAPLKREKAMFTRLNIVNETSYFNTKLQSTSSHPPLT